MNVTRPVIVIAVRYSGATLLLCMKKNMVDAANAASVNENTLNTRLYWPKLSVGKVSMTSPSISGFATTPCRRVCRANYACHVNRHADVCEISSHIREGFKML